MEFRIQHSACTRRRGEGGDPKHARTQQQGPSGAGSCLALISSSSPVGINTRHALPASPAPGGGLVTRKHAGLKMYNGLVLGRWEGGGSSLSREQLQSGAPPSRRIGLLEGGREPPASSSHPHSVQAGLITLIMLVMMVTVTTTMVMMIATATMSARKSTSTRQQLVALITTASRARALFHRPSMRARR